MNKIEYLTKYESKASDLEDELFDVEKSKETGGQFGLAEGYGMAACDTIPEELGKGIAWRDRQIQELEECINFMGSAFTMFSKGSYGWNQAEGTIKGLTEAIQDLKENFKEE